MTQLPSSASLRSLYLEWVEEQLEEFKDSVPRSELLNIADEVVAELQMNRKGQYQLTELLLLEEVDRTLFRRLKLPGFRAWATAYREELRRASAARQAGSEPKVSVLPTPDAPSSEPRQVREVRNLREIREARVASV
ncbi:MAG: hypothetical protein KY464_07025 [Gemmatimonadetes bacterium]|nr:hypothetical protein [Gemmatimonadota bacterium]